MSVRLEVGVRGTVIGCTTIKRSGDGEVDRLACWFMIGMRFDPALDPAGRPLPSIYIARLRWQVPPVVVDMPQPTVPAQPRPPLRPIPRFEPPPGTTRPAPLTNPGSWVRADDYPPDALRADDHGSVAFTLWLDASGTPVNCTIIQSQVGALLTDMTCDLMMARARFKPARDASGAAIPSTWSTRFSWSTPDD